VSYLYITYLSYSRISGCNDLKSTSTATISLHRGAGLSNFKSWRYVSLVWHECGRV